MKQSMLSIISGQNSTKKGESIMRRRQQSKVHPYSESCVNLARDVARRARENFVAGAKDLLESTAPVLSNERDLYKRLNMAIASVNDAMSMPVPWNLSVLKIIMPRSVLREEQLSSARRNCCLNGYLAQMNIKGRDEFFYQTAKGISSGLELLEIHRIEISTKQGDAA